MAVPVAPTELALFAVVGLLGGAHCLGMCGPLVTTYADRMPTDSRGPSWFELRQHALFNLGRTASYALVGGLLGLLGATVYAGASLGGVGDAVRGVAGVLVGALVITVGVGRVLGRERVGSLAPGSLGGGGLFSRVAGVATSRVDDYANSPRIALLGAIHAFLPCPLLYPAFVYALGSGEPVAGALNLAALGVGTIPTLFLYGTVLGSVPAARRAAAHRVLGVAFVFLGLLPLLHGLGLLGVPVPMLHVPHYVPPSLTP
ncbi:sulfite exporter TauE/SafE family protein [Halarchaeum sp. CBA1220]|uniref:sulfite exporter TauE/SafE family protein n=1 Tax=Halarchaeum sp. CBA1220 TaxID=1853682 RepID=UPI000F3A8EF7|nr:sulfite exporter TauE/SafE family protein [Halarchaeum sp. CBA1220]QLC34149.1 sulfite exporter TauE/SafE family protein [Halarchaeum sp. CBA1220]